MKNNIIGLILLAIYFTNSYICSFIFYYNIEKQWYLKYAILSLIIILAIKYKEKGNIIEKLFISMVANNIYVLLAKDEFSYTLNDIWFIAIFTLAQYLKTHTHDQK
jgi:hypothetical protein